MRTKILVLLTVLMTMSFVLSACASAPTAAPKPTNTPVPAEPTATTAAAAAEPTATTATAAEPTKETKVEAGKFDWTVFSTEFKGKKVSASGPAVDQQAMLINKSFEEFEKYTGIEVDYEGTRDFETLVLVQSEGKAAPDLGYFAQPGLLKNMVKKSFVVDLSTFLDKEHLKKQYKQSWLDLAMMDGKVAGVWHNADVKSLVWYPVPEFEKAGYKVPQTWEEMIALSDKMVKDGNTPWCIGIESSGATGWVGTDWIEDIMLRTTSPENYDKWTNGQLKFESPEVKNAFQVMSKIWLNPDYVYGGTTAILTTPFGDSPTPLFDNPPKCFLHRQASFITNFFPKDAKVGTDVNYFYLPPIDAKYGKPVLGSGALVAMMNDRPEVREVMKWLTYGESGRVEAEAGVQIAPQNDASLDWYPPAQRGFAEILMNADTFRFDGSDLMPGAVGAGAFWTGMVDYVNGQGLDEILKSIDAAWPK